MDKKNNETEKAPVHALEDFEINLTDVFAE